MAGFIKSVLIFTLLVTVMKGLINNSSFQMYFKFSSGLVLVLFMITPLINFLSGGNGWYSLLEQEIFNFDMEGINDGLKVADGKFEEIIRNKCQEDIKEQIKKLAENRNINVKDINIGFSGEDNTMQVVSVDIETRKDNQKADKEQEPVNNGITAIEDIKNIENIDINTYNSKEYNTKAVDAMSGETGNNKKPAKGKNVEKLKEDISSYFIIKEAAVNIWE